MTKGTPALSGLGFAELRRRLEEAEETLRAIREGEIDALVVRDDRGGDGVFTLEGGTESYRSFMEAMDLGAAAFDAAGRLLYANKALCQLLGRSLGEMQAVGFLTAFDAASAAAVGDVLSGPGDGRRSREITLRREAPGDERHLLVTSAPLPLGLSAGIAVTFTDMTERVRAAAFEESERMARAVMDSANEAVVVCDRQGIVTHANAAVRAIYDRDVVGLPFVEALPVAFNDPARQFTAAELVATATGGRSIRGLEAATPGSASVTDILVSAAPLQVIGDTIRGCVVTLIDLTQRKAAEKQQALLMAELDHRVKNILALVVSIARHTAATAPTLADFQGAFLSRVQALAAAHDLLARKSLVNLTLEDLVLEELAPYASAASGRVAVSGLRVGVTPRTAIALGLVVHELATNAAKYGALSNDAGRVSVRATDPDHPQSFGFDWVEEGGPLVQAPTRKGFGQTVIARSLGYTEGGGADVEFRPAGVIWHIRLPRSDLL
ncbi:MAG: sensor histidine kinase [Rhodospirillaceae bacterium]